LLVERELTREDVKRLYGDDFDLVDGRAENQSPRHSMLPTPEYNGTRMMVIDETTQPVVDELKLPKGYRLTKRAQERLDALGNAVNRRERRALLAYFRKHPLTTAQTLEKIS
jgi:hypothetical protein